VRCAAAHCEQRAADARAVARGARRLRCGRGEGETCGRDAVAERRCTRRIRVGWWRVRPRKAFAPKAPLSCVDRLEVIRSSALPCCENRARGNARSHGAAGHDSFSGGLRRSHRRHALEQRGRAETCGRTARTDGPDSSGVARRLPRARSHTFSRAPANGVTRRGHSRGFHGATVTSSRGRAAGSKSNVIPLRFPRGAGATFARAADAAAKKNARCKRRDRAGRGKRT